MGYLNKELKNLIRNAIQELVNEAIEQKHNLSVNLPLTVDVNSVEYWNELINDLEEIEGLLD